MSTTQNIPTLTTAAVVPATTSQQQQFHSGADAEEHIEHHHMDSQDTAKASQPLLSGAPSSFKRTIMVALDASESSDHAFQWALDNMINANGGDLLVLATVREPVIVPGYMDFGNYITDAEEQSRIRAHALVKQYGQLAMKKFQLTSAADFSKLTIKGIVMRGDPRDEIVRKAHELNATAVVLGSRGMGAFKRTFIGSVSDYIVHHSEVPVVIVKHPQHSGKDNKSDSKKNA